MREVLLGVVGRMGSEVLDLLLLGESLTGLLGGQVSIRRRLCLTLLLL